MKTIYTAVMARLQTQVPALKWIDLDTGQLNQAKPPVTYPCALIGIKLPNCKAISDTLQDCNAVITIKLAFDTQMRTAAGTPEQAREASLAVYDTIADVYKALQGYGTANFDSLSRTKQGDIPRRDGLFEYDQEFATSFEDATAEA